MRMTVVTNGTRMISTDPVGLTGCTVVLLPEEGAVASVDVRGAAPGTRETDLLHPSNQVDRVHAVLLSGGSAFGWWVVALAAALVRPGSKLKAGKTVAVSPELQVEIVDAVPFTG